MSSYLIIISDSTSAPSDHMFVEAADDDAARVVAAAEAAEAGYTVERLFALRELEL